MGNIVKLTECYNSFEAQLIRTHLESEGIPAMVTGENMSDLYCGAVAAFNPRVLVNEEDLERAQKVLETVENTQEDEPAQENE